MLETLRVLRHALRACHDQFGQREPPRRRVCGHVELRHHAHPAQPRGRHDSAQVGGSVGVRRVQRAGGEACLLRVGLGLSVGVVGRGQRTGQGWVRERVGVMGRAQGQRKGRGRGVGGGGVG